MKFKPTPLFDLGQVVATPGALDAMEHTGDQPIWYLSLHVSGQWGDLEGEDKAQNDAAVRNGDRIMSAYPLSDGTRIWIITEWDRSVTTILLPEEY